MTLHSALVLLSYRALAAQSYGSIADRAAGGDPGDTGRETQTTPRPPRSAGEMRSRLAGESGLEQPHCICRAGGGREVASDPPVRGQHPLQ